MIVVDTSVWADHFNGRLTAKVLRLRQALTDEETLLLPDLVLTEVLQGIRKDDSFEQIRQELIRFSRPSLGLETYVEAARLYRRLRANGLTIRGTVDCIIAQICIEIGAALLGSDGDFEQIARHSMLTLVEA